MIHEEKLTELKGEIEHSIITVEDFNSLLLIMDGTTRKKNSKEEDLNHTKSQADLMEIEATLYSRGAKYTFFPSECVTFHRIDLISGLCLNKC